MSRNPKPARILIIDDNNTTRHSLAFMLNGENYSLQMAASGKEALEMMEAELPDVILLDVVMPGMDGFELCEYIKSRGEWKHIPIILITSLASQQALVRGLEIGADEFLTKPVSSSELKARIRSMLRIKVQFDDLKAMLRLREEMAHMMAHDIRNPLAVAALHVALMSKKSTDPNLQRHADVVTGQIKALDQLINETLIMAKSAHSELVLNLQPVDVNELVTQLHEESKVIADSYSVKLRTFVPQKTKYLMLDPSLFRRTLDNLISNALKFSPVNSQVSIELSYAKDEETVPKLRVKVIDQGSGVPQEEREKIFKRFETGTARSGTSQIGMGLSFCKLVVDAHGGIIYVNGNEPNGAIFVVEI